MHRALTVRTNLWMVAASAAVVGCVALFVRPRPDLVLAVGAMLGVVVGVLQSRSIAEAAAALRTAGTALELRRALTSNASGRWALWLQWASVAFLAAASIAHCPLFVAFIGGYGAFVCAREATALRAVVQLNADALSA